MSFIENNRVCLSLQHEVFSVSSTQQDRGPGEVDLHDLYVKEAIERADQAVERAKRSGLHQIDFIVGKIGQPAMEDYVLIRL